MCSGKTLGGARRAALDLRRPWMGTAFSLAEGQEKTRVRPVPMFALALAAALAAVGAAAVAEPPNHENEIVVTARLSGAPMWTVETDQGAVVLVGEIREVPEATPWQPERLQAATKGAQRVLLGTKAKVSPGDIFRLIFSGGRLTKLPERTIAADYLTPAQLRRLAVLETRYDQDYSRRNFLVTAFDLLSKRLDFDDDSGPDASEIVRDAADDADIPAKPIGTLRGEDIIDNLFAAVPQSHVACLESAMTAAEEGPRVIRRRAADWIELDVPAVMANPLEQALARCWPWADDALGAELRGQWVAALEGAIKSDGVTLAVAPLRILAEPDGVLDQLDRRGFAITGPEWQSGTTLPR